MKKYLLLFLYISLPFFLIGQDGDDDFQFFIQSGIDSFNVKKFDAAKKQFEAARLEARLAENNEQFEEAFYWYSKTVEADIQQLKDAIALSDSLRGVAEEKALLSLSNLSALQARNDMDAGDYTSAFDHALKAKITYDSLGRDSFPAEIEFAFGQSVFYHLNNKLYAPAKRNEVITDFQLIPGSEDIIVIVGDQSIEKVSPNGEVKPLAPRIGPIYTSAISPDGKNLFVAYNNKKGIIIDIATGTNQQLPERKEAIVYATFSPDGQYILSCSRDDKARLWNLQGDSLAVLEGHSGNIYSGSFSPTEEKILTRSADGTARIWDFSGKQIGKPLRHRRYLYSAEFSADGKEVLTSSADGNAKLWNNEGKFIKNILKHKDVVIRASYIPNQSYLMSYSVNKSLKLFNSADKETYDYNLDYPISAFTLLDHQDSLNLAMITGQANGDITEYYLSKTATPMEFEAHNRTIKAINYYSEKNLILSSGYDDKVKLWRNNREVPSAERNLWMDIPLNQGQKPVIGAKFAEDGKSIYLVIDNALTSCPIPDLVYDDRRPKELEEEPTSSQGRE